MLDSLFDCKLGLGTTHIIKPNDINSVDSWINLNNKLIDYAYNKGIRFFESGRNYCNGFGEVILSSILSKYPRDSYFIAFKKMIKDKYESSLLKNVFELQQYRTDLDYFDFYYLHNVNYESSSFRTENEFYSEIDKSIDFLLKQKFLGKIRFLGYSTDDTLENMEKFLKRYHNYMEFCQIEINWISWFSQRTKEKIDLLNSYKIPIFAMEPLRAGRLFIPEVTNNFSSIEDMVTQSFKFLIDISEIKLILFSTSSIEHIDFNLSAIDSNTILDSERLFYIGQEVIKKYKIN